MRLLVFDTSNSTCCAGVYETGEGLRELSYRIVMDKKTHSETLLPAIDEVLKEAGLKIGDIDIYGVTIGPGSFTGIRIGISTVKGLSLVTGKKVYPVSSTMALAKSVDVIENGEKTYLLPCFDARNKRVFASLYDEDMNEIIEENAYDSNDLKDMIDLPQGSRLIIMGSGTSVMKEALGEIEGVRIEDAGGAVITPSGIAKSAVMMGEDQAVDALVLAPKYCARSQAERFRKKEEIVISETTEEDVDKITVLEAEGIKHPWGRNEIRDLVLSDAKISLTAKTKDGEITGYLGASFILDEAEMGNICVSGRYRREGIASKLMDELKRRLREKGVKTLFLEVSDQNLPAIGLYDRLGFETYGVRRDYYGDGEDALLKKIEL